MTIFFFYFFYLNDELNVYPSFENCEVYPSGFDLDSQLAHFSYDVKHLINMRWLANPT
jgi:hypothetical protein